MIYVKVENMAKVMNIKIPAECFIDAKENNGLLQIIFRCNEELKRTLRTTADEMTLGFISKTPKESAEKIKNLIASGNDLIFEG